MPRPYQTGTGASMSGRTYEPQVTPWDRADDDFDVYQGNSDDRDRQASGRYSRDRDHSLYAGDRRYSPGRAGDNRTNDGQDAYTRRDLQPTYQDAYERDRERYGRDGDDRAYRGANRDQDFDRDLVGSRSEDRRDRDERHLSDQDRDKRDGSYEDRPWTGFASNYERKRW